MPEQNTERDTVSSVEMIDRLPSLTFPSTGLIIWYIVPQLAQVHPKLAWAEEVNIVSG